MWTNLEAELCLHGPIIRYPKLRVAHAPGMPGTFSPATAVSDPDTHHGTCVTHVPWCMSGSLTSGFLLRRRWENVPGIPGTCATHDYTYLVRGPWFLAYSQGRVRGCQLWHIQTAYCMMNRIFNNNTCILRRICMMYLVKCIGNCGPNRR